MTLPVAIIGCGLIGAKRATAFESSGHGRVVATFDPARDRAEQLASTYGASACATAREAAQRAAGGVAVIATVHDALADLACLAASEGCHVLVEKPGGRTSDEVAAIETAVDTSGVHARVGFNHRFHPSLLAMHRRVRSGEMGHVLMVRARYGHGGRRGYEQEWRASRDRSGGGELLDQGVHLLDLTRFLVGDVSLCYAALPTLYWEMDVEDNAFVHARSARGAEVWLHASWTEWKNVFDFEVMCQTAKLRSTGLGGSYGPESYTEYDMPPELGPPLITETTWPPGDSSWVAEIDDFASALAGQPSIGATLADARAVLDIVGEAYRMAGRS